MSRELSFKELYNKWEKFVHGSDDVANVRKEVLDSWKRCRQKNINPYQLPPMLSEQETAELIEKNRFLKELVDPYVDLISDLTKETNFLFILADSQGYVVDVRGDKQVLADAKISHLRPGSIRTEDAGTNAICMALYEDKPVQIMGPEHYNIHLHRWTCSAAPVHDIEGRIIGVLCLSGHYSLKHNHTLGMIASLAKAIEKELIYQEKILKKTKPPRQTKKRYTFEQIVGQSPSLREAIFMAKVVSYTDTKVLLEGESGTGKELFARAIHGASKRADGPFVAANCGAIPAHLFESEFFGYMEGAFTGAKKGGKPGLFELANGGTLFLDEINSLSLEMQAKLLRVLQDGEVMRLGATTPVEVDVRVIAASNEPLEQLVEQGKFRADLYYRLGVMVIQIPPLRQRPEDIPLIFQHLLDQLAKKLGYEGNYAYDESLLTVLQRYAWPGNVREMENYIERALILAQGQPLSLHHFPAKLVQEAVLDERFVQNKAVHQGETGHFSLLEKQERELIRNMLIQFNGNITKTSEALGITRNTLYKKIKIYGLRTDESDTIMPVKKNQARVN